MINLAEVETRIQEKAAGATTTDKATAKGKIIEFAWNLKKDGYSQATIQNYINFLELLVKFGANLYEPESVKDVIANRESWSNGTKLMAVASYSTFALHNKIYWDPPKYTMIEKLPFIPLESEIDTLIAGCGKKMAAIVQTAKETGARIGEILRLKWTDIDFEHNTLAINGPEKRGKPRMFKISNKLISMLNAQPKESEKVFGKTTSKIAIRSFWASRKLMSAKLQNPRLLQIHFHTLRHWKATMEYAKTRNPIHVMQILGQRNLQSILKYTQLINFESDEWHVAHAQNLEEETKLLESGFEFVRFSEKDKVAIYRKRK